MKRENVTREGRLPPTPVQQRPGLYVIGLTGSIATGKSAVAKMLAQLGARVIDADALAHQVMRAGTPAWHQIVEQFGRDILQEDGEIDRTRLGAQAFAEPAAMARLEAIVHPAVIAEAESLLQQMQRASSTPASDATKMSVLHPRSGRLPSRSTFVARDERRRTAACRAGTARGLCGTGRCAGGHQADRVWHAPSLRRAVGGHLSARATGETPDGNARPESEGGGAAN